MAAGAKVRPFGIEDWPQACRRLVAGFGDTGRWERLGRRLREMPPGPPGEPLGHLLDTPDGGGILLTFSSLRPPGAADGPGAGARRVTNLSSWVVDPPARGHAVWLLTAALRDRTACYTDLTADPAVVPLLQRLGFEARLPSCVRIWTPRAARLVRGEAVRSGRAALDALAHHPMAAAFAAHRRLGCRVLALHGAADDATPLAVVLRLRRRRGVVPVAEVVWADGRAALGARLPTLCGWLLLRGVPLLEYEADAAHVPPVPARRLARPRFSRGPSAGDDRIDQLHSELVYLDVG